MAICVEPDDKRIVEETWIYPLYQSFFIILYLVTGLVCGKIIVAHWMETYRKDGKISLANNRYQVIFCLTMGALVRAFSFIDANCVVEEIFRFFKDVFWMAAFVLIVLFWVELQTQVQQMSSIEKLKPYLIVIMAVYCTFRLLTSIAELYAEGLKTAFNGLTVLVYLSVMAIGQYYGQQLLSKIKKMKTQKLNAQLMRLTIFIILENVVLLLLLVAFVIRTLFFKSAKQNKPWLWFYLKTLEKVLELISIIVLCLTMAGKSRKNKPEAGAAKPTRSASAPGPTASSSTSKRRTRKKKPSPGAAGGAGAGVAGAGGAGAGGAGAGGAGAAASKDGSVSTPNPVVAAKQTPSQASATSKTPASAGSSTAALLSAEGGDSPQAKQLELVDMSAQKGTPASAPSSAAAAPAPPAPPSASSAAPPAPSPPV